MAEDGEKLTIKTGIIQLYERKSNRKRLVLENQKLVGE
jgi:hypothetical protein